MKAENLRIAKVFSSGGDIHYVLPHFQREWEKHNWETLLDDALGVYEEMNGKPSDPSNYPDYEHFLGSIVVIQDGMRSGTMPAFKLVDGQQRLTTISLVLKALASTIQKTHTLLGKKIDKLLVNPDESSEIFFKILPTTKYGDRAAYAAIMKGDAPPANESKIPEAFGFFLQQLRSKIEHGVDPEKLFLVITNAFQVVFVELNQNESPYKIFESLNAKGKPLSQADLVRNYVAMQLPSGCQEKVFNEAWGPVETLLHETRSVGRLGELTAFIRHYLAMRMAVLCNERHVYERFRDRIEASFAEPAPFETELRTMARFASHYDRLLRPARLVDGEIAQKLDRLNRFELSTAYPFLLELLEHLEQGTLGRSQVVGALDILESYIVRRYLAGEPTNFLNKMFPGLWGQVSLGEFPTSLKIALANKNCPTNAHLRKVLIYRRLYDRSEAVRGRTALILDSINRKLSEGSGGYTVLSGPATIEHILPQTVSPKWKDELGVMWEQIHRDYVHTIGNLTLVTGDWNSELSNSSFDVKKAKLSQHALMLNSTYFSKSFIKWGRDEILERTEELGNIIVGLWPSLIDHDEVAEEDTPEAQKKEVAEFHFEALETVAKRLGKPLIRLGPARFKSDDGQYRLVGLCSKKYPDSGEFWYGFKPSQLEFLKGSERAWLALECETPSHILLFPLKTFEQWLEHLNVTEGKHWHIRVNERMYLHLPLLKQRVEVSQFLIPIGR